MKPQILTGDVRETLKTLPSDSVHCCVTSPPYWALRSYLKPGHPLKSLEIGSEPTPEAFIATMVEVFREVRRVLHPSGTCWVNIGDSYAGSWGAQSRNGDEDGLSASQIAAHPKRTHTGSIPDGSELKPKDLCLIPERLSLALQADGWWVRSRIAWCNRAPMPESVTDRPTSAWEHVWLLTKSARYFYDAEAVKEQSEESSGWAKQRARGENTWKYNDTPERIESSTMGTAGTRNLRNFWLLGPEPYNEAHFATFPSEIPKRAILAGTSARGCCPKCLAPWERVVENLGPTKPNKHERKSAQLDVPGDPNFRGGTGHGGLKEAQMGSLWATRTIGWQPTCECGACDDCGESIVACKHLCCEEKGATMTAHDPIPCTVLDPFLGSGTTAAVAIELGRRAIGCELNPEYIPLIEKRTLVTPGLQLA